MRTIDLRSGNLTNPYGRFPMISDYDLIMKAKLHMMDEATTNDSYATTQGIIDFYHHYDGLSPVQHTYLVQYCMSRDWAIEENIRKERQAKHQNTKNFEGRKK